MQWNVVAEPVPVGGRLEGGMTAVPDVEAVLDEDEEEEDGAVLAAVA